MEAVRRAVMEETRVNIAVAHALSGLRHPVPDPWFVVGRRVGCLGDKEHPHFALCQKKRF
jgi:hypothetical protein